MKNRVLTITLYGTMFCKSFIVYGEQGSYTATKDTLVKDMELISKADKDYNSESSTQLYLTAKRIIVDSLPGEQVKAEKLLIESIRQNPKNINAYVALAKLIQSQVAQGNKYPQELHKSITLINQAYEIDPERPKTRFASADILFYTGQVKSAEDLYLDTMTRFPNHRDTYIEKTRIYSEKNPQESIRNAEAALKLGASTDDISQYLSSALIRSTKKEVLANKLKSYAQKYPDRWLWHKTALAYANNRNYKEATNAFEKAITLGNDVESRLQLAVMQYSIESKNKKAIENLNKLITILGEKEYISTTAYSLVYAHLSLAYFKDKKNEEAALAATYAAKSSGESKQFYTSLVAEYKKINALYILDNSLNYLIKEEPSFELPYTVFAEINRNNKKYGTAIEMYDKAISLEPKRDDLFAERAITYYKSSSYENALEDFEAALKLRPHTAIYLYNKACMLALLGKKADALKTLKLAFIEDKKLIELARVDSDFASIKSDNLYSSQFASLILEDFDEKWSVTESEPQ
ncbi:tetratricopeptide repeat protein [Fluviispira vulneris]|uniref:tetratricopeptide repeat protein n=1 Tax=Fluviispira vulneris TaxID=2763012 RepID=UPI001645C27F|nr:tetratricopeptide repeat protein [Fluviispira vulneris]